MIAENLNNQTDPWDRLGMVWYWLWSLPPRLWGSRIYALEQERLNEGSQQTLTQVKRYIYATPSPVDEKSIIYIMNGALIDHIIEVSNTGRKIHLEWLVANLSHMPIPKKIAQTVLNHFFQGEQA